MQFSVTRIILDLPEQNEIEADQEIQKKYAKIQRFIGSLCSYTFCANLHA